MARLDLKTGISVFINNRRLGLCASSIYFLADISFTEFRNVIIIQLSKNELCQLRELKFPGIKNLLWIELAGTDFTSFPKYLPDSLELLDLRENQINEIRSNEISYLGSLKRLILTNNNIDYLS